MLKNKPRAAVRLRLREKQGATGDGSGQTHADRQTDRRLEGPTSSATRQPSGTEQTQQRAG